MIPLIIVLLIVLLGVIAIIIYPKWLTQPVTNISKVNISSEFLDLEITDQKMMSKLYNLCNKYLKDKDWVKENLYIKIIHLILLIVRMMVLY